MLAAQVAAENGKASRGSQILTMHNGAYRWRWDKSFLKQTHDDIVTALALAEPRDWASELFGQPATLDDASVWATLVVPEGHRPYMSQLWHRDPLPPGGWTQMIKLFWYLTDVTPESGALEYVAKTHLNDGYVNRAGPHMYADGPRQPEALSVHPRKQVLNCPADTWVAVNTQGLHRGGLCTKQPRLSLSLLYVA